MRRIAGLVSDLPQTEAARRVRAMLDSVRAQGSFVAEQRAGLAAFGACGREGAAARRGNLIAVVDGSVFNHAQIGIDRSAAEVFVELFERLGPENALARINGDFAAAVYDETSGTLWLARDRVGLKPLYYVARDKNIAFASRPRMLLALPGVSRRARREFVGLFAGSHYRTFDNDASASPFADIAQLPAGHLLVARDGRVLNVSPYWTLREEPEWTDDEATLAARYRELLLDAVSIRAAAATRPAFTLSGGMDSSSVLACAVAKTGRKHHAFSSVYEDSTYDESTEIRSMLDSTVETWHPVKVGNPDVPAVVQRMVGVHDEPVATATWLSHFLLCEQAAAQGFDALFGGLGGDELNAGEYEYFFFHFADLRRAGDEEALAREVAQWQRHHDHPIYRKSMAVVDDAFTRLVRLGEPGRCLPDRRRVERYVQALAPDLFDLRRFDPVMDQPFRSYLKNRTYQDIYRETAPCCLRAEDRQTAAFGLDHFDPFFDYRLLEFMFRVPGRLKIRDGVTKILLRAAMQGILPEETRTRIKKTGWNAPAHVWFAGSALTALEDLIASQAFRERGVYDVVEVQRILREHKEIVASGEPRENHMMFLWQLVNLEAWFRELQATIT